MSTFWKEVCKEKLIFSTSINKVIRNGTNTLFWKDRWLSECALQSQFPMLYDITTVMVSQIIGYNRYYLFFTRPINDILRLQLQNLYISLSNISLNNT
jgi:hypothetical protein